MSKEKFAELLKEEPQPERSESTLTKILEGAKDIGGAHLGLSQADGRTRIGGACLRNVQRQRTRSLRMEPRRFGAGTGH